MSENATQPGTRPGKTGFVADMTLPFRSLWNLGSPELRHALPARLHEAGFNFVSITVCGDDADAAAALRAIGEVRSFFMQHASICTVVGSVEDIMRARDAGKLAIGLHFQGTVPVGRDLTLIGTFYALGIRHMLMAYNQKNFVADGCHEIGGTGLSRFGREVVREMNRVGMFVDIAHTSYRAAMDVLEFSDRPVIVSHGNVWALHEHPRCYRDDQIKAVASSGGVIGLTGLSIFTGDDSGSVDGYVRQIDYVAQLVGAQHVGFGFDYVYDMPALSRFAASQAERWPTEGGYTRQDIRQIEPERVADIADALLRRGYSEQDVRAVIGANWLRLMREVWK